MSSFWQTFFNTLGYKTVWGAETNGKHLEQGSSHLKSEMCLPAKAAYGQLASLIENNKADILFFPHILADKAVPGFAHTKYCPYICALPSLCHSSVNSQTKQQLTRP